jgi:hypothetical protein
MWCGEFSCSIDTLIVLVLYCLDIYQQQIFIWILNILSTEKSNPGY